MIRCGLFVENRTQKPVNDQSGESIHQGCIKEKKQMYCPDDMKEPLGNESVVKIV